jgi:hypothetical protein
MSQEQPKKQGNATFGCMGVVGLIVIVGMISQCSSHTDSQTGTTAADPPAQQQQADAPAPPPPPVHKVSIAELKREFIGTVDESISGQRIAGAKFKFVGTNVDLHGKVGSIVDDQHFNLMTGSTSIDDDGNVSDTSGVIVIECQSTHDLEQGQVLRVLGTVINPIEGNNAMGGNATFPAVRAEYME